MAPSDKSNVRRNVRGTNETVTRITYSSAPQHTRAILVAGTEPYQFTRRYWSSLDITAAQDHAIGQATPSQPDLTAHLEPDIVPAPPSRKRSKSATSSRRDSGIDAAAPLTRDTISSLPEDDRPPPAKRARRSTRGAESRASRRGDDLKINGIGIDPAALRERVEWQAGDGKWYEVPNLAEGEVPWWSKGRRVVVVKDGKVTAKVE